jgi:hypothetical protein
LLPSNALDVRALGLRVTRSILTTNMTPRKSAPDKNASGNGDALKRTYDCDYLCPECDIGAHERCANKKMCRCTHPVWTDIRNQRGD